MPTPRKQTTPFPGFSLDHFNYGLQMGLDHHGGTQYPWESPFGGVPASQGRPALPGRAMGGPVAPGQPYMVGENGPEVMVPQGPGTVLPNNFQFSDPYAQGAGGFNPPGNPGMGDMPGPGMGYGPGGGFAGMGGMAGDTQGGPPMGGPPSGPSDNSGNMGQYGVWGDQDLVNNPDYAAAGQTAHPKWNRFLQYMNTPEARDSMFMGVILSQMGTDPKGALQLALQFKDHIANRNFQAQQAEANRQAKIAAAKASQTNSRVAKVQAAALQHGVDLSAVGGVNADNVDMVEPYVNSKAAEGKAQEAIQKQQSAVVKAKRDLLNDSIKHDVDASKYIDPASKDYDPAFKNAYLATRDFRQKRQADTDQRNQVLGMLRKAEQRLVNSRADKIQGQMTDTQKATFAANKAKASALLKMAGQENSTANDYEVFGDDWPAAAKMYGEHSANAKSKSVEALNLLNKMASNPTGNFDKEFAGLHEEDDNAREALPKQTSIDSSELPDDVAQAMKTLKKYGGSIKLPVGSLAMPNTPPAQDDALAQENARRAKLGLPPKAP